MTAIGYWLAEGLHITHQANYFQYLLDRGKAEYRLVKKLQEEGFELKL